MFSHLATFSLFRSRHPNTKTMFWTRVPWNKRKKTSFWSRHVLLASSPARPLCATLLRAPTQPACGISGLQARSVSWFSIRQVLSQATFWLNLAALSSCGHCCIFYASGKSSAIVQTSPALNLTDTLVQLEKNKLMLLKMVPAND